MRGLLIRRNASVNRLSKTFVELYQVADQKCDYNLSADPEVASAFINLMKIFKGEGQYNQIVGSEKFRKLLNRAQNPYVTPTVITGQTSFQKRPSNKS